MTPKHFIVSALSIALGCAGAPPPQTPAAQTESPFDSTPAEPSIAITGDMGSPHLGDTAPDFELKDQDGNPVKLSSLHGKVVLIAFVTSWCPFSAAEQPNLAQVAADYAKDDRVRVLAIDIREDDAKYRQYLARVKMPIPVLRDAAGDVTSTYTPARAQPSIQDRSTVLVTSNVVVDPEGKIRFFTMVDTVHFDSRLVHARRAIDALLAKADPK
jgi:peroxiredoxin